LFKQLKNNPGLRLNFTGSYKESWIIDEQIENLYLTRRR